MRISRIKKIIVHHSADTSAGCQLSKIDNWHKHKDFPKSRTGKYVGYHALLCEKHGVHYTRFEDEVGAHDQGENYSALGVCMPGNFDKNKPPKWIEKQLGEVLVKWVRKYKLTALDIEPHRIHDKTSCYGWRLDDRWASRIYLGAELSIIKKTLSCILMKLESFIKAI